MVDSARAKRKTVLFWMLYCLIDIVLVGMGMGIPAGPILLGFPLGWILVRHRHAAISDEREAMRVVFRDSIIAMTVSLALMLAIWLPTITVLFDPAFDIAEFGHPFWLYDPLISYYGWLILMIVVSPVLQLLATVTASYAAIMTRKPGVIIQ